VDGDTSHIAKTIIDGSQPGHPDSASVVSMVSGEDTTSVLCGLTLRGGKGTLFYSHPEKVNYYLVGGGVNIFHSGGIIENNVIEDNHLTATTSEIYFATGSGISAWVFDNHKAVIRNNLVRNNTYDGDPIGGGGVWLAGGGLMIEGNTISGNISRAKNLSVGGGIGLSPALHENVPMEGVIDEVIIRKNIITANEIYGSGLIADGTVYYSQGAGIALEGIAAPFSNLCVEIYNNLIYDNHAHNGWGGGMALWDIQAVISNNTILNNKAERAGKQLALSHTEVLLFNNILWSDTDDNLNEFHIPPDASKLLIARHNNIKGGWKGEGNISSSPKFVDDSYELSDSSLCIGRGADSMELKGTWYFAPEMDIYGNIRPDTSTDSLVDIGAIESGFSKYIPVIEPDQWFSVDENSAVIGIIYLDTAKWESDSVSYSIIDGDPVNIFEINSSTREILVPDPYKLDYEDTAYHKLTIRAEHNVVSGTTIDIGKIYIEVNNINDNPPVFKDDTFSVQENSAALTAVGTVSAEDPDGDVLYFEIMDGNINNTFSLSKAGFIRVANPGSLDYESRQQFILTVVVKELNGPFSDIGIVTINVTDDPTYIASRSFSKNIRIYPNPAKNKIYIEWPNSRSEIHEVEIISMTGKTVYRNAGNVEKIDVSVFTCGLYFVKVWSEERVDITKVLIVNQ
jgi:hypothetical protein